MTDLKQIVTGVVLAIGAIMGTVSYAQPPQEQAAAKDAFGPEFKVRTALDDWVYPDSILEQPSADDVTTVDGDRSRYSYPSHNYCASLTSMDSCEDVVRFYRALVQKKSQRSRGHSGRHPDWEDAASYVDRSRSGLELHFIALNTPLTSTTVVVTRLAGHSETHILWTRHAKMSVDSQIRLSKEG